MPKYQYKCNFCGEMEIDHSMNEVGRPRACPLCACSTPIDSGVEDTSWLERIWNPTAPIFKGGGWAKDNYNKGGS